MKITQASKYLFRFRAAIAAVFFLTLVLLAKPATSLIAHVFIAAGIALRLWAAGYIGPTARSPAFSGTHRISNGPYRLLKHPLYAGNFFLVLGVVMMYNPPRWLGIAYIVLFLLMYGLISLGELYYLRGKPAIKAAFSVRNLQGEISTLIVMVVIYALWFWLINRG
ncbi:MAG: methyltransferase [candidate division WOR-3 bacterium]